jgi:glycosyltransferase involved in cell wall biosynthesis
MTPARCCYVSTSELMITAFLGDQIRAASERYAVTIVTHSEDPATLQALFPAATLVPLKIERQPAPWRDLCALFALLRLFRRERFDLVHAVSPKGGLLAMIAARLAGVRARIFVFTGQVWATRSGLARRFFKALDRVIIACTTHALADSPSQRDFMVAEGVAPPDRLLVMGHGSICGVDCARFKPDAAARAGVRARLGIPADACLLLYLGRLGAEKGLTDLCAAFRALRERGIDAWLAFVGPDEMNLEAQAPDLLGPARDRVRFHGYTPAPEQFFAAADVLCLPSYREGFGNVVIEAAACGVPASASRIYGVTDAVADGETGLLHPAGDRVAIAAVLERLIRDPALRQRLGEAARIRACRDFGMAGLTQAMLDLYAAALRR